MSYRQIVIKRNVTRRVPLLEHELLTQPEENHIYQRNNYTEYDIKKITYINSTKHEGEISYSVWERRSFSTRGSRRVS